MKFNEIFPESEYDKLSDDDKKLLDDFCNELLNRLGEIFYYDEDFDIVKELTGGNVDE